MMETNSFGSSAIVGLFVFTLILLCISNGQMLYIGNQTSASHQIQDVSKTKPIPLTVSEHKITASELSELKDKWGTYQEGVNYSHTINGYRAGVKPPTNAEWIEIAQSTNIVDNIVYANTASSVDNSKSQYFPPIGNQGSQSSCVAWSVGYYTTTFLAAKQNDWNLTGATMNEIQLETKYQSNVMSPAFVYNLINNGEDTGASFYDAIKLVCGIGASSWKNMPYNQSDYSSWPSQTAWIEAPQYRGNSSGYQYMPLDSDQGISNLKNLLASGNLASINVDSDKFSDFAANDTWTLDNYISPQPSHAGTVVGYDDDFSYTEGGMAKQGAFKIANSWGIGFYGEKIPDGYYWISYEALKQRISWCCYFFEQPKYTPDLLATFNVNDTSRGACTITVGLGEPSKPIVTKCFNDYVSGGSEPFPSNNVAMDVTEFKSYLPSPINQPFFLQLHENGDQIGTVNYFAIGNETASGVPCSISKYPTATYLNVTFNSINPEITMSPTSGSAGSQVTLSGVGFTPNSYLSISFLNPVTASWSQLSNNVTTNSTSHFSYQFATPDITQNTVAGDNPATYYNLIFQARDNSSGLSCNTSVPFLVEPRGLSQVGSAIANELYGNNTYLTSIIVKANQQLTISGRGFYQGNILVLLDGTQNIGTFLVDNHGFFNLTITIPMLLPDGQHNIVLADKNTLFVVTITASTPLPPTPTEGPSSTPTLPPTPIIDQSPISEPTPDPTSPPTPTANATRNPTTTPTPSPPIAPTTDPTPTQNGINQPTSSTTGDATNQNTQPIATPQIPELNIQTIVIALTILAMSCIAIKVKLRKK